MTEFFKAWIISLSGIIIFGSMCEMILPNNSYKKYIHLTIGLMLILSIINPFVNKTSDISFELPDFEKSVAASENDFAQIDDVFRIYKHKLTERICEETGASASDINISICESDDNPGAIERVIISSGPNAESIALKLKELLELSDDKVIIEHKNSGR